MKVTGLDGKTHNLTGKQPDPDDDRPRSSGHLAARLLLARLFPLDPVLEELTVPGCRRVLYLDFFLPRRRLAVEVQGAQHRAYSSFFHGAPAGFLEQRKRDQLKRDFCSLNNLTLVELHDNTDERTWERAIRG